MLMVNFDTTTQPSTPLTIDITWNPIFIPDKIRPNTECTFLRRKKKQMTQNEFHIFFSLGIYNSGVLFGLVRNSNIFSNWFLQTAQCFELRSSNQREKQKEVRAALFYWPPCAVVSASPHSCTNISQAERTYQWEHFFPLNMWSNSNPCFASISFELCGILNCAGPFCICGDGKDVCNFAELCQVLKKSRLQFCRNHFFRNCTHIPTKGPTTPTALQWHVRVCISFCISQNRSRPRPRSHWRQRTLGVATTKEKIRCKTIAMRKRQRERARCGRALTHQTAKFFGTKSGKYLTTRNNTKRWWIWQIPSSNMPSWKMSTNYQFDPVHLEGIFWKTDLNEVGLTVHFTLPNSRKENLQFYKKTHFCRFFCSFSWKKRSFNFNLYR